MRKIILHVQRRARRILIRVVFLLMCIGASSSFALAGPEKSITLEMDSKPLTEVFKALEKASGLIFIYSSSTINVKQTVSVSYSKTKLEDVLADLGKRTGFSFTVDKKYVVLLPKSSSDKPVSSNGIEQDKNVQQATKAIKGIVVDENGTGIPGTTIAVVGTSVGTAADAHGRFTLDVPISAKSILFSFIGYASAQESIAALKDGSILRIMLKPESKKIEEVVVTGFGNISKERSTGAVVVLSSEDITERVNFNLVSSLEGQVAGMSTYGGDPLIRGTTSFRSNTLPLIVVDGLPIEGTLSDINPLDVESITVLKDAASASIYGVRAGNGIIVVTTKTGEKGKTTVNFSADYSITPQQRVSDLRLASTSDIIDYERYYLEQDQSYIKGPLSFFEGKDERRTYYSPVYKAYRDYLMGEITEEEKEARIAGLKNYDYRKEYERLIWRKSLTQQYNLSVRKGADKMDIAFSANYRKQQFSTVNNNSNGITLNFKSRLDLYSWLTLTCGAYGKFSNSRSPLLERGAFSEMPYARILDDNGNRVYDLPKTHPLRNEEILYYGLPGMEYNVLDELEMNNKKSYTQQLRAFAETDVKLYKGLTYNLKFQYQKDNGEAASTYLEDSYHMRSKINKCAVLNSDGSITNYIPLGGRLFTSTSNNYNYAIRNQINYNTAIKEDWSVSLFAGTEFSEMKSSTIDTDIYGYDPDVELNGRPVNWQILKDGVLSLIYDQPVQELSAAGTSYLLNRVFSLYSNGSLSYKSKYVLAGSWRVDQTNLFGVAERDKFRPLWSVSASWNASEESFLKKVEWMNLLKLRASWGVNGNVDRGSSPFLLAGMAYSSEVNETSTYISSAPNPTLRWEKTESINVGLDFRLFQKLSGTIEFYNKYTSDLLARADLDPSTGHSAATYNNGAMLNRGIELSLNYSWLRSKDWSATTSVVMAYNRNEVKQVDLKPSYAGYLLMNPKAYYRVGDPYNSLYAFRYAGITDTGDPSVYDAKGNVIVNATMKDPNALVYMGTFDPPITGSLSQNVAYRNFTFNALLVVYLGHKLRRDAISLSSTPGATLQAGINDRWTEDNKTSEIPRFPVYGGGDRADFWMYGDNQVESASMLKLRNVGLGYKIRGSLVDKLKIQGMQVKAQVNNLWYWSAAGHGIDPESFDALRASRNGVNKSSFIFSINLTF